MGRSRASVNRILGLAALLAVAGCGIPVDQRGNLPQADKLAEIKPGVTDKAQVTQLLGSPSSVAAFDPNVWYYISQKTQDVAFLRTEILDQKVVAVAFDDKGVVRDVAKRNQADGEAVTPNPNATPASGREFSFLEQLLGNFGRFSAKAKGSNGGGGPGGGGGP